MNKTAQDWGWVIGGIILVVLLIIGGSFLKTILPKLEGIFTPDEFEKLPLSSTMKQVTQDNWGALISNVKACSAVNDSECICEGFPEFPTTFHKDFKVKVHQNNISLVIENRDFKKFSADSFLMAGFTGYNMDTIKADPSATNGKRTIDFTGVIFDKKQYPLFGEDNPIISDKFYKDGSGMVSFVTNQSIYGIISVHKTTSFSDMQSIVGNQTICLGNRQRAIASFNYFISCLKTASASDKCKFSVEDMGDGNANNYRIFIGKPVPPMASLKYDAESVKQYDKTQRKSVNVINATVLSPCTVDIVLENGASVKFAQQNGKICMQKSLVSD